MDRLSKSIEVEAPKLKNVEQAQRKSLDLRRRSNLKLMMLHRFVEAIDLHRKLIR